MTASEESKSVRLLIDLLKSEDACLRGAGAFGLSLLGRDARLAVKALAEALAKERDAEVARAIVFALEDIGCEAAPGLVPGLRHPIAEIQDASSEALATLALTYRESGEDVPEMTEAFAAVSELCDLMVPLGEHLGLSPASLEELMTPPAGERDTFKAVARKRELGNALRATKRAKKSPH
jgi:hypothetical protein